MIDLHTHSTFSDGSLTPEELIDEAARGGITGLALTDHDTTAGLPRFIAAAMAKGIRPVPGVEISADFKGGTMHMLGYFVDPAGAHLNERLKWMREGRELRNAEILKKLQALGFKITWEEVASYAGEDVVGRPHFAQALLAKGYVADKNEAFDKYLGKGKAAYVDRRRLTAEDSVTLIRSAGGVPVLAHPFTLNLGADALDKLLGELRPKGLGGVETYYSEHTREMEELYLKLGAKHDLVPTGGSDFHGALTPDIRMGRGFGSLKVPADTIERLEARRG